MKKKALKSKKIHVKDIEWLIELLTDKEYEIQHGTDSHGITLKDNKKMHVKLSSLNLPLLRHELFHVYSSSCCIDSTNNIEAEDMEEISAEIIAYHLEDIDKKAKELLDFFKGAKNAKQ